MSSAQFGAAAEIRARVAEIFARVLEIAAVPPSASLFDLGGDSQHAVLIALELERTYSIAVKEETLYDLSSVEAIAAWIEEQQRSGA